jgi:chromosome transmission fidelity protein 1
MSEHSTDQTERERQALRLTAPQKASDYRFPFTPYDIQLAFMQTLFDTIERGCVGIFESPTGTVSVVALFAGRVHFVDCHLIG